MMLSETAERRGLCVVSTAIWVIGTDGVQLATELGGKSDLENKKR